MILYINIIYTFTLHIPLNFIVIYVYKFNIKLLYNSVYTIISLIFYNYLKNYRIKSVWSLL